MTRDRRGIPGIVSSACNNKQLRKTSYVRLNGVVLNHVYFFEDFNVFCPDFEQLMIKHISESVNDKL